MAKLLVKNLGQFLILDGDQVGRLRWVFWFVLFDHDIYRRRQTWRYAFEGLLIREYLLPGLFSSSQLLNDIPAWVQSTVHLMVIIECGYKSFSLWIPFLRFLISIFKIQALILNGNSLLQNAECTFVHGSVQRNLSNVDLPIFQLLIIVLHFEEENPQLNEQYLEGMWFQIVLQYQGGTLFLAGLKLLQWIIPVLNCG